MGHNLYSTASIGFCCLVGRTPAAQGKWVLAELLNVRADNGVVPGGWGKNQGISDL